MDTFDTFHFVDCRLCLEYLILIQKLHKISF
nr:MAG TPA: hypothetical protein [Bacteriophage sp.]